MCVCECEREGERETSIALEQHQNYDLGFFSDFLTIATGGPLWRTGKALAWYAGGRGFVPRRTLKFFSVFQRP